MGSDDESGDECSVIGEKGEIGFIDYDDDKSVCSYVPEDEGPIVVSVPFPFSKRKPQSALVGSTASDRITVKNTTSEPVELWGIKIYASTPENSFTLSLTEPPRGSSSGRAHLESFSLEDRVLQPGETLVVWLSCKPEVVGLHTSAVHFDLETDMIERLVFLLADDNVSKNLAARAPYSRGQKKTRQFSVEHFVTAPRPPRAHAKLVRNRLPRYLIPSETREMLESKEIPDVLREGLGDPRSYNDYFKCLLIMEELQLKEDMSCYDMENVAFKGRRSQHLALEVPGLAERRPSLVHGDSIFAKLASECGNETSPPYMGSVFRVEADEVFLKFAPEFHTRHRDGSLYNIQFKYNRINMRRLYQAIDASVQLDREFLFPSDAYQRRQIKRKPLVPISCDLNEEQTRSIEMVLGCEGAPPYVIHGPPGTGKTVTLVEMILQLYKTRRNSRILVCAPSNNAADHILEKLLKVETVKFKQNEIFRLNASARLCDEMSPDFFPFCFFEEDVFKCPALEELSRFRIIVSTYMCVSVMHVEGLKRGHFSHIFLDEAGQASEPETMISVANLCRKSTVVVLAGDPLQLGPVIYSKEADSYGLGKSYLERIFSFEAYKDMDENYVTKLVRNYRCHREILHLPSQLFYDGELIACREGTSTFMEKVDFLPSREFPVMFFGIQGCDEREGSNPSWFNRFEASKVVDVVKKLTENRDLDNGEIGIITPYRQQVLKLKTALEHLDRADVKVGSVEQFQGQERQVIIVSTVRSTIRHNESDKMHCLGFLSNPKRFNVAMTRAISLLIIIGNPHIICKDAYWNMMLWRCIDNNSYEGCVPPERQELAEEYLNEQNGYYDYGSSKGVDWTEEPTGAWAGNLDNPEPVGDHEPLPADFPESSGWGNVFEPVSEPTGWE